MPDSLQVKVIKALNKAVLHNSELVTKPEVILWPDSERQWAPVIPILQKSIPEIITFGEYKPELLQGPAIWIKCMVGRMLPEANWSYTVTPIIYLPGISKQDLKNVTTAGLDFQPLIEYQYTGTIWTQDSGKEWTILAFLQNKESGLGLTVAQDNATKEMLKKSLVDIFENEYFLYQRPVIDANYLNSLVFPDVIPSILKWLCTGDLFLSGLSPDKKEAFQNICKTTYGFDPDYRNIKEIVEKFGAKRNGWDAVWKYFANSPHKYPELQNLLKKFKPEDLGEGVFALPVDSWPQVNEEREDELRKVLSSLSKKKTSDILAKLIDLESKHKERKSWVWTELGYSPFVKSLEHLVLMTRVCNQPFPFDTVPAMLQYYTQIGYNADQAMRRAYASVKTVKDKEVIKSLIGSVYTPWLESITQKFQDLVKNSDVIKPEISFDPENETFFLFVDAFRYELASEFVETLCNTPYKVDFNATWSALPSLTPTSKPTCSPIAHLVSKESDCIEFRPQLMSGKDLQISTFRESLKSIGFFDLSSVEEIDPQTKGWFEVGDIDKKGHTEQAEMVRRVEELFDLVREVVDEAMKSGVKRIKIVTDHGWLLLPGGLPKTELPKDLTETRWGRCALIKEGAKTKLQQLPWHWNPSVFIAYAPSINFFKKNEEYAHGGLSIHECLVPVITIENASTAFKTAKIENVKWVNLTCKIELSDAKDGYLVDIRTKFSDPSTSIVISQQKTVKDNRCTLMVDDGAEGQSAIVVIMTADEIIHDKKPTLVGH